MNRLLIVFWVWLIAMVQGWFLSALGFSWIVPNLIIVVILALTLSRSWQLSIIMAIWAGFWLDIAAGHSFGLNMFTYALFVGVVLLLKNGGLDFGYSLGVPIVTGLCAFVINASKLATLIGSSVGWRGIGVVGLSWIIQAIITAMLAWLVNDRLRARFKLENAIGARG